MNPEDLSLITFSAAVQDMSATLESMAASLRETMHNTSPVVLTIDTDPESRRAMVPPVLVSPELFRALQDPPPAALRPPPDLANPAPMNRAQRRARSRR